MGGGGMKRLLIGMCVMLLGVNCSFGAFITFFTDGDNQKSGVGYDGWLWGPASSPGYISQTSGWMVEFYASADAVYGGDSKIYETTTAWGVGDGWLNGSFTWTGTNYLYAVIYDSTTVVGATNMVFLKMTASAVDCGEAATPTYNTWDTKIDGSDWVAVPEPASALLLLAGASVIAVRRRFTRNRK